LNAHWRRWQQWRIGGADAFELLGVARFGGRREACDESSARGFVALAQQLLGQLKLGLGEQNLHLANPIARVPGRIPRVGQVGRYGIGGAVRF